MTTVRRIVMNIAAPPGEDGAVFYSDLLGLDLLMDQGWIKTWGAQAEGTAPQISIVSEGGSGAPTPDMSVEVDDVDEVWRRAEAGDSHIVYALTDEPWGARRFMVCDPFGKIVNIMMHI